MKDELSTRLRLDISYDGTDFAGWGIQPQLRTVQGTIEAALAQIFTKHGTPPTLVVAGRTDAGVHAMGQVAHLDLNRAQITALNRGRGLVGAESLARRLNGLIGLTGDLVVVRSSLAAPGFDARFSALWRRYEYRVRDASIVRNPMQRSYTLSYPILLDLDAMSAAAEELLGLHDWASYCKPRERATTIRNLQEFSWRRDDDGVLIATVVADAFCHSMVRSLVGACLSVGTGSLEPGAPKALRDAVARTSAIKTVPPTGLTLVEVGYPPDEELAERAELTRARRNSVMDVRYPNGDTVKVHTP